MNFARGMLDLLYPITCSGCGKRLPGASLPLCGFCTASIQRADNQLLFGQIERLDVPIPFLGITFALWMYDKAGSVQRIHHALKYQNRPRYGIELGRLMGEPLHAACSRFMPPDLMAPVPLHSGRYLERGYNQSLMLAEGIRRKTGMPLTPQLLHRANPTHKQTGLGQKERWENVKNAFACSERLCGAHILLIDDVITTGSTLLAAATCLFEAGASCVSLAALAFARP